MPAPQAKRFLLFTGKLDLFNQIAQLSQSACNDIIILHVHQDTHGIGSKTGPATNLKRYEHVIVTFHVAFGKFSKHFLLITFSRFLCLQTSHAVYLQTFARYKGFTVAVSNGKLTLLSEMVFSG